MMSGRFGDCETAIDGWLGQPSNTLSSLGYIVAALVVVIAVRRHRYRLLGYVLAGALGLVGLGSFLFHGTGTRLGDLLHTVSIPILLLSVVAAGFVTRGSLARTALPPMILLAVGLAIYGFSRTGGSLCDPDSILQGHAAWHMLSAAAAGWFGVRAVGRGRPDTSLSRDIPTP